MNNFPGFQRWSHRRQKFSQRGFWLKQCRDLILIALVLYGISTYLQRDMVTGQAPTLQGIAIDASQLTLATNPATPTLVYFWGTWCPACKLTSPMVESISHTAPVISVAVASGTDNDIQTFMIEHQYKFPVLNDHNGLHSQRWGAMALPAIYIIDSQGQIRYATSGITSSLGMQIRLWLASINFSL